MRNYQNITIKIGNICVLGKWEVKPNMENRAREIGFFKKKEEAVFRREDDMWKSIDTK